MLNIIVNDLKFLVKPNISILEACKYLGINIPKFCYHESLSVAGNCRMCLVELQKVPKPVASCAMPIVNDMIFFTSSVLIKKARENVLEALLINHPLDCPICDQGGECDLQDETKLFGIDYNRFFFNKRIVEDKNCGLVIKTIMTRCIHCTRCVRFTSEVAGTDFFGTINRGTHTEISNYVAKTFNSYISGNVIDLCPVGALTSKLYAFKARPWELKSIETLDLTDGAGTSVYFHFKESEIVRVLPKVNFEINDNWISDRIRFSFDAFKNSRLHFLFEKQLNNTFKKIDWNYFFIKIAKQIKNFSTIFLVNEDIDLKSLLLLKKISILKKDVQLKNIQNRSFSKNYTTSWLSNKIVDIKKAKTCFLIFINMQTENIVINTKIKSKQIQNSFQIVNFGKQFNSIFPINYINITVNTFLIFLESKLELLSKLFIKNSYLLFVFGETLYSRIGNQQFFVDFIKNIAYTSIILSINIKSNKESFKHNNIKNINSKDFIRSQSIVSINLEDTLDIRKILNNKKETYWLNTYGSNIAVVNKYIVPIFNYIEENNTFLNLEQRPQKTKKLLVNLNKTKSLKKILEYIIEKVFNLKTFYMQNHLLYINQLLKKPKIFKKSITLYTKNFINIEFNVYPNSNNFSIYSNYPAKYIIEDFFSVNNFCKNSLNLNKFSVNARNLNKNFYL